MSSHQCIANVLSLQGTNKAIVSLSAELLKDYRTLQLDSILPTAQITEMDLFSYSEGTDLTKSILEKTQYLKSKRT